eukprot:Phypoly_transcript_04368.p1 GENE.Phypoly_transcript_04368~~Phypoly_transcript_04368.p1  ORF type:complete len:628 (+),score=75.61 Phypoly_transcript_04368:157-2040(+)
MSFIDPDLLVDRHELAIYDKIASGTFGDVYRAKWGKTEVAVKKVFPKGAKAEDLKKLIQELHTLLKVRHPLVLSYYGACVGEREGEVWIIMEYANGHNLNFVLQNTQVPGAIRTQWAVDALRAVEYLHKRDITHKGLKSTNFLLVDGVLKIADFGMEAARNIQNGIHSALAKPPPSSSSVGVARWLAPECADAQGPFTVKSDVFALGMLLWEISDKTRPFPEIAKDEDVITAIKLKLRPKISPECNPLLKLWMEKCWDHEASNRPTVSEVYQAFLDAFLPPVQQDLPHYKAHKENRKYFEVNIAELNVMKPDKIQTLTQPPEYPLDSTPAYIPSRVHIYTLSPPPKGVDTHMLDSEKYEARLFRRVDEYFQRFYVPTNPSLMAVIESVEVICNTVLEQQFEHENSVFNAQFKGLLELKKDDDNTLSSLQKEYLQNLLTSKNLKGDQNSNPISAWHGFAPHNRESICWYGLLNLNSNDPGYFGKGIYFTQKPSYGELYANSLGPAKGKASLLLCWVLLGRPWPVTKVKMSTSCMPNHTSHYVVVSNKMISQAVCADEDYDTLKNTTNYYPVEENESAQGDEIVVFRSEQVLPRFIVNYTVVVSINLFNQYNVWPVACHNTNGAKYTTN